MPKPDLRERIRGSMLGGAVGDALGAPIEFDSLGTIRERFGQNGLVRLEPAYGRRGAITDDTQMTLFGADLESAAREALEELRRWPAHEECAAAVEAALARAGEDPRGPRSVETLGAGWVAEEALSISLYCALAFPDDFRSAVLLAVNHGGDSDSTGAITGNLMGALLGERAIPGSWLADLELRRVIDRVADELAACGPRPPRRS